MAPRKKAEEVTAEIIEEEPTAIAVSVTPANIVADFVTVEEKVRKLAEPYEGITAEGINGMELEQMRRCHAELNSIEKQINDAKIAVKKQYEEPYKAFEAEVKRIIEIVQEPRMLIKACIADKERGIKDARREHLEEVYHQFLDDNGLPSFAANVPFDAICDRKLWDTSAKSYQERQAENELCDKVASVMREWQSFQKVKRKLFDPEGAERKFWETLSTVEAMNYSMEQQGAQEAVEMLHEEAAPYEPEKASENYVIKVSMTENQREQLIGFFKAHGIKGTIRRDK